MKNALLGEPVGGEWKLKASLDPFIFSIEGLFIG